MKTGILLINLGIPDAPTVAAVRRYLREFLTDPYVVDLPWLLRWPLVNLIIAPLRASYSARLYQSIWTKEGSPLLIYSQKLAEKLQKQLGENYHVALGMRYGKPNIDSAAQQLLQANCDEIII